jgi:alpha-ketoglutarate-dependent taurine dioxygenase
MEENMSTTEQTRLDYRKITPFIGTEILADKATLLRGEHASEIRRLLEETGVLVFPKIDFTDEEQITFTTTLGKFAKELKGEEIYKVSLDKGQNSTAEYLKGAFLWHIDGTMSPMPILASLLASKVRAPEGGDTDFCNTYAAYDALSDADKEMLAGKRAIHTLAASQLDVEPEPTTAKLREWLSFGKNELPLVWTHRSGRKSLVIGATAHFVVGMGTLESKELLVRLRDHATQPQFSYRHVWSDGDAVMWDNTGTMHRATAYALDSGRMLHRTKLEGEEPFAA